MPKVSRFQLTPVDFGGETLGQRIGRIRRDRGFTQTELATRIGIIQSIVSAVEGPDRAPLYTAQPHISSTTIDLSTAREMRKLMNETVRRGTSSRSFRGFFRHEMTGLDVGGKTGSLTGFDPPGKYDWFIGFADAGERKIAVAALTVHEKLWRVKSSYLARKAFESYFKDHAKDPAPDSATAAFVPASVPAIPSAKELLKDTVTIPFRPGQGVVSRRLGEKVALRTN